MSPDSYAVVRQGQGPKGDIFTVAKIAGIMGAKRTPDLVPLCHPLAINFVDVSYAFRDEEGVIEITSTVRVKGTTGVEMEAMTCAMITALTIYDMCKAIDKVDRARSFLPSREERGKERIIQTPSRPVAGFFDALAAKDTLRMESVEYESKSDFCQRQRQQRREET